MSATRSRPPTITDIARHAGVSTATVSYVLNDTPGTRIPEATRQRVSEAAEELGYVPHASARSLRTGRSDLVVYAMPAVTLGPLAARFLSGLADELQTRGFTLVLHGDSASRGVKAARRWARLRPAAVVAEGHRLTRAAKDLMRKSGTVLVASGGTADPELPSLVMDHHGMGSAAGRHLASRGCRDVAAVVPAEPVLQDMGEARAEGVAAGLEAGPEGERADRGDGDAARTGQQAGRGENGDRGEPDASSGRGGDDGTGGVGYLGGAETVGGAHAVGSANGVGGAQAGGSAHAVGGSGGVETGEGGRGPGSGEDERAATAAGGNAPEAGSVRRVVMEETPEDAARIVREWRRDGLPDGVFGFNDEYAGLLLSALIDAGVEVPGRVRLVGGDDLPLCGMLRPRLTSVALRAEYAPAEAADRLIALIAGEPDAEKTVRLWFPELRIRDSS